MQKAFQVGTKTFILDQAKAEAAFADKKVINGRVSMTFNLLPLKYQWSYDLYRTMKANHWEPKTSLSLPTRRPRFRPAAAVIPAWRRGGRG